MMTKLAMESMHQEAHPVKWSYITEFLTNVQHAITNHFREGTFNVEQLCTSLHCSQSKLYRIIKNNLGCSPCEYINQFRLKAAHENLMTETYKSVKDIAYDHGFNDPAYFSRLFTRTYGISPNKLKKSPTSNKQ